MSDLFAWADDALPKHAIIQSRGHPLHGKRVAVVDGRYMIVAGLNLGYGYTVQYDGVDFWFPEEWVRLLHGERHRP